MKKLEGPYNYYDYGAGGTSPDIINAAESGFFDTQDVILCVGAMPALYGNTTVTDGFEVAHNSGTELYGIYGNKPPECFDYYSAGNTSRTIDQYYTNMVNSSLEESVRLENAEALLVYLTMAQKITYISYKPNSLLEEASQTNAYSDLIDYTFINYYDYGAGGTSPDIINAAGSGFFDTQDVILCVGAMPALYGNTTVTDGFEVAHNSGTELYGIYGNEPPECFDYYSIGNTSRTIDQYYTNMVNSSLEESVRLENAEDLLVYLTMATKITYISYKPNTLLEEASHTNAYGDLIDYTFINYYDYGVGGTSPDIINAAGSGFFDTQDAILCVGAMPALYGNTTVTDGFEAAHNSGTELYGIYGNEPPECFDYYSVGNTSRTIDRYYTNMVNSSLEEQVRLENAENMLLYLGTEGPTLTKIAMLGSVDHSKYVFVLGTELNGFDLLTASNDANISEVLDITVFTPNNPLPGDFDFSRYGMIFIESQDGSVVEEWSSSIMAARRGGAKVIGYNLSSNVTLENVDLYSEDYTDIERYWIQGGEGNMKSMLLFMGQTFSELCEEDLIPEPVLLKEKVNLTFITGADSDAYYLSKVFKERAVVSDNFNVNVMTPGEAIANFTDTSGQDLILVYMVGGGDITTLSSLLSDAKDNGVEVSLGNTIDVYGLNTIDTLNPPHNVIGKYLEADGQTNMENLIRYIGAEIFDVYIGYSPVGEPPIPDDGIYHPDAWPKIFDDSTEYLNWYSSRADGGHVYDPDAPTIGIIAYEIQKDPVFFTTDNAIIRYIESRGCNVIYSTNMVCIEDVDYFTQDDEVLVDVILTLQSFRLNLNDPDTGVEYLQKYNVPVLKGVQDAYTKPEEFYNSTLGVSIGARAAMVTQPELDGCLDFAWISGAIPHPEDSTLNYYQPIQGQVEYFCDRAIGWAELGNTANKDKKISILYWNHDGGKDNIGASYLDISSSFTLLLEQMEAEGYDLGNGTIPDGDEFIDLFITSRNVGAWAPGELEEVVESGFATLMPVEDYLPWYNTLPESVREEVESFWGEAPGDIMVYENESGKYFVIPTVQVGNVNFIPQPTKAKLSDESLIYHNESIPLTHQYLAAYHWINEEYDADAIIHFGTHGTLEWSPGKEIGLWEYDYPSICAADTPIIYPYIMDNVGEGSQAKHRGYAVMIDHLTPPIVAAGIYGDLVALHDKIHQYTTEDDTDMRALYRNSTIQLYDNLSLATDLGVSTAEMNNMTDGEFENFVSNNVHEYLHTLQDTLMPYGVHTFGVAPEGDKLICMITSMLGDDFTDHVYAVLQDTGNEEDMETLAEANANLLLNATLLNGTGVIAAQDEILGLNDSSITADLELAIEYADKIAMTTREIDQTIRALDGEYIEPGPGNDPVRNPEALPTGRNFYGFDQRRFPDAETYIMGSLLADQLADNYKASHGYYPSKISYVLWAMETLRHEGLMEAQIYSLLGVEPTRDALGSITGFNVTPLSEMNHPRIDVLVHSSGLYRDTFAFQLKSMDQAVRMVAELNESCEDNYVRCNSLAMEAKLLEMGYNESQAEYLSRCRIFSEAPGNYDNGMEDAIAASDTWDNESKLADLFISTSSYAYGEGMWGDGYEDLFTMNLMDVDAAIHSDSSNLFGLLDGDGYASYLGSIGLTIRVLTGETPELYISNQENVDGLEIMSLTEALRTELRARDFNPAWITGMMEGDYAGARQMVKMVEYLWMWEATNPDLITDSDWNEIYEVYFNDKYDLGIDEFLETENPYSGQSIMARMIETARKTDENGDPYWDASDAVLNDLVKRYVESVVESGVTCCHHTCGNAKLADFIDGNMQAAGVTPEIQQRYNELMFEATLRDEFAVHQQTDDSFVQQAHDDSLNSVQRAMASGSGSSNQTMMADSGGAGTDYDAPVQDSGKSTPDNYVQGYEMTHESVVNDNSVNSPTFSSSDILASVFVVGALGAIYVGFWKRRKF